MSLIKLRGIAQRSFREQHWASRNKTKRTDQNNFRTVWQPRKVAREILWINDNRNSHNKRTKVDRCMPWIASVLVLHLHWTDDEEHRFGPRGSHSTGKMSNCDVCNYIFPNCSNNKVLRLFMLCYFFSLTLYMCNVKNKIQKKPKSSLTTRTSVESSVEFESKQKAVLF